LAGGLVSPLLRTGERVGDRLVVDRLLGEGAFAEVHRVRHEYLGFQAMKVFKKVTTLKETHRVLEEARLLSTLGHPNIVRMFDAGTVRTAEGLRGYFTTEYVAGGSLRRVADAYEPTAPVEVVADVIEQIAQGLAVGHRRTPPIVHRDITLENVLVGYDEGGRVQVRLSDFGLAIRADPFSLLASAQGTYAFMAPEVLRQQGYSRSADVWSVGTIAYLLLTDRLPYDDGSPVSSYSASKFARPPLAPSKYNGEVDAALDQIVLDTLVVDPDARCASAEELAEALRRRRGVMG
jgi:serine/threonine-protein kinase